MNIAAAVVIIILAIVLAAIVHVGFLGLIVIAALLFFLL